MWLPLWCLFVLDVGFAAVVVGFVAGVDIADLMRMVAAAVALTGQNVAAVVVAWVDNSA